MKTLELNNRNERNECYAKDFNNWVKSNNVKVLNNLPGVDLEPGQKVTYTNDYGVKFEGYTVLGFCTPDNGRCVYLNKDSYWFPVDPKNLTIENKEYEPQASIIMKKIEALEKDVDRRKISIKKAIEYIYDNDLQDNLPVVEDYCEVRSSGRSQNVSYYDFVSSGDIIDWSYQRLNFYKNAVKNEDGELEVKIYHSDFVNYNGEHFETVRLYDILLESDL